MRPTHPSMYGQPTYVLPQNPVQYYTTNSSLPQYGRSPQDLQPVYLVPQQPVMHQYPALVGVPTQVVGNPIPQAMAMQGVHGYGAQGWAYRPAMVEPQSSAPVWGYGADRSRGHSEPQQEPRMSSNWQPAPSQGHPGSGGFQGRVEGVGNGLGSFQGRADGRGNGVGGPDRSFQGRSGSHGNVQSFGRTGNEVKRPDRGFETSRHYSSNAPGRQHMNRQALPPQSPAPLQAKQLSCEPCEKTFPVYAQYTAHMNTHVQCDDNGCSFSASGKVVKEHKLTAHSKSSNLIPSKAAFKISEESSDENKAWREERRRNYPTRLNIQRKKEILEGKVARGELIDEDARQRRQRMKEILAKQAELGVPVAEVPAYYLPHKDDRARGRKNCASSPTGNKQMSSLPAPTMNGSDSKKRKLGEDADVTAGTEEQPSKSARMNTDPSNGHSNSVVSSAELPTQSECESFQVKVVAQAETESVPRDEAGSRPLDKPSKPECYFFQRGRCRKGPKCHFAHTRGKKRGEGEAAGRGRQKGAGLEKKRPPTLLSKLLQADITRDKSYILQCLRFFVNNNFLVDGLVQHPSELFSPTQLTVESDAAEDSSDYSEGEVVEAPDVLLADTAIINTLLSEPPEVLAKVLEMETQA